MIRHWGRQVVKGDAWRRPTGFPGVLWRYTAARDEVVYVHTYLSGMKDQKNETLIIIIIIIIIIMTKWCSALRFDRIAPRATAKLFLFFLFISNL